MNRGFVSAPQICFDTSRFAGRVPSDSNRRGFVKDYPSARRSSRRHVWHLSGGGLIRPTHGGPLRRSSTHSADSLPLLRSWHNDDSPGHVRSPRRATAAPTACLIVLATTAQADNWYTESFWLLHEDHHTRGVHEVGRDADLEETRRLVGLVRPDMIQIHAKGNPGWTTYPSKIGHTPPQLVKDVLAIWRDVARRDGYHFSAYYNIGRDGEIMQRRPEWNRMFPDGSPVDKALCYHSGVAEDYLWPMIREIMHGYHPRGFWFDGSCFTIRPCYCPKCTERFRKEQRMAAPEKPADRGWTAYQEMQRQIYREFIRATCREIHAIDPDCLVAFNWAYSIRMPEKPEGAIAYLTGDIGNRVEGLSAEAHWYDSTGVPFDLMTQISTVQRWTIAQGPRWRCGPNRARRSSRRWRSSSPTAAASTAGTLPHPRAAWRPSDSSSWPK